MAKNDVRIVDVAGLSAVPTRLFPVQDYTNSSSTQILAGEPVRISGHEGGNYVLKLATAEPLIGTDIFVGIAKSDDTATSTADGTVEVYLPVPNIVYECAATDSDNFAAGIIFDTVTFDLTSTTYTIDENEGTDENVHGLRILSYDSDTGMVQFQIKTGVTMNGDSL